MARARPRHFLTHPMSFPFTQGVQPVHITHPTSPSSGLLISLVLCFLLVGISLSNFANADDDSSEGSDTAAASVSTPLPTDFAGLAGALVDADFDQRQTIVQHLASSADKRTLPLLMALADGRLNSTSDTPARIVIVAASGSDPEAVDALSGKELGPSSKLTLDAIPVNNALRGELRNQLARLQLSADDSALRLSAAKQLISDEPAPEMIPVLQARLKVEQNTAVHDALATVLAMADLASPDATVRLASVNRLSGALYPEVRAKLADVADTDPDHRVQAAAKEALRAIGGQLAFYHALENLFFGLSLGSVLLLAAVGLSITFGVMGVINMAHGELIMLGAYTTYVMQQLMPEHIGLSLVLSIPVGFLVAALVGIAIERGVIRFLYGRPLETLLATFGVSLILQQAVRSIFSPLNREVASPSWMSGSLEINPVLSLTNNRLIILAFSLVVFMLLMLVLKRTSLGLKLRAVAQNRSMARAVGVRASWIDALTFGLGSGIAGVAGVALSQLTNVGPNLGQSYIIDSFMVVVFGGAGNLWGTLVGAMGLGIANKFLEPFAGSVLAKILVLIFIILFIQKRPRGLFPQKGRSAEH